jgi:hypothetical protein
MPPPRENAAVPLALDAELDRLYGADLCEFVAQRKRIAAALRQEGRKAEAAEVLALRKPSLPAWAVNQLVRRSRKDVDALIEAGSRLTVAQQALVGAGDRAGFANARRQEQAVVKKLRRAAAGILDDRASEAMLERIAATLEAAAVTPAGREQLAEGRLTTEIATQGFEAFAGTLPAADAGPRARPAPASAGKATGKRPNDGDRKQRREEALSRARATLKAATDREADAAEQRRQADRVVKEARRALDAAERRAARVEADRAAAAEAVQAARRALDAAKKA